MAISPDGRRVATGWIEIQQWDAANGQAIGQPMEGHTEDITGITYSPDGRDLVSAPKDRTLRFWDAASGRQIGEPVNTTAMGDTSELNFSQDGRRVFVTATESVVEQRAAIHRRWDLLASRSYRLGGHVVRQAHLEPQRFTVEELGLARHPLHGPMPGQQRPLS